MTNKKCFWHGHSREWNSDTCNVCGEKYVAYTLGEKLIRVGEGIIPIAVSACIVGLITLLYYLPSLASCSQFANQNHLPFVFKFWYGCLVNYSGHWVSPDSLVQLLK
jgi:hypothetical protein